MPRKPRQERSRATVDAIVEAGFLCVARHGIAHTTTRHIAEAAGISVGSLYEYFTNKEDVFDAMNRRFVDDVVALIREISPQVLEKEMRGAVETLFHHFGEFLTRDDERYLKVARQVVNADTKDYLEPISKALTELFVQYLMRHPEYTRLKNIPTMAYIFINSAILLVLHHLASEDPPIRFGQLSRGLADLVGTYIEHSLDDSRKGAGRAKRGRSPGRRAAGSRPRRS